MRWVEYISNNHRKQARVGSLKLSTYSVTTYLLNIQGNALALNVDTTFLPLTRRKKEGRN